jgi:hypothetical protein
VARNVLSLPTGATEDLRNPPSRQAGDLGDALVGLTLVVQLDDRLVADATDLFLVLPQALELTSCGADAASRIRDPR